MTLEEFHGWMAYLEIQNEEREKELTKHSKIEGIR
jgi:hypothetical protein|tara:strand:- start:189 stop:293 length:105 start_codon:yes stop_codon:yes gene_type:complete